MPRTGPLAGPAPVSAAAWAAAELGYASIWVPTVEQLAELTAAPQVPVGLLVGDHGAAEELRESAGRGLGRRPNYLAATETELESLRPALPTAALLSTSTRPPRSTAIDGWSPLARGPVRLPMDWRPAGSRRVLVLRLTRLPTDDDLRRALAGQVDEVVVGLPAATTLDEQLAGFADIAERLAAQHAAAGHLQAGSAPIS